ncbi:MAG: PAS domain S-box protein [Steroidobacteraceae bacterium]
MRLPSSGVRSLRVHQNVPPPLLAQQSGRTPSTLTACIAVCAGYTLAGAVGVWLLHLILRPDIAGVAPTLGVPWLAVGAGVAGLMIFGTRAWPGVFAGSCITWGVIQHDLWSAVLMDAAGETVSIVLIVWLFRIWDYRPSLERYQDALILVAAVALGRIVSSSFDILASIAAVWMDTRPNAGVVEAAAGVGRSGELLVVHPALFAFALRWWANSTVGVVLVVPLLAFLVPAGERRRPATRQELGAWALAVCGWLAAALTLPGFAPRFALLAGALVLVVWAALRLGVAVASVGTLVFSMCAAVGFGLQLGTFAGIRGREGVEVVWGFIGLLTGAGLFLTALLSGLERVQRQSGASVERYRRLFFANPTPIWAYELATGRIVAVNAAAVAAYGHTEETFLRLSRHDLYVADRPPADGSAQAAADAVHVCTATHRIASGRELDVEMTSVPVELDGTALRVCLIDVVGEREDLRLAVLKATDLVRQRLGDQVREGLGPTLARLGSSIGELLEAVGRGIPVRRDRLLSIEQDSVAATKMCRQLSRGASLIHFVSGDLIEALRRLSEELAVDGGPEIQVSVHSFAPLRLPLERCEHIYGLARDAVRAASLRPNVRSVRVAVDVTSAAIEMSIEDDGTPAEDGQDPDISEAFAMGVRASAAQARLEVGASPAGGNRVKVECRQAVDLPPIVPMERSTAAAVELYRSSAPAAAARRPAVNDASSWLSGLLLAFAYVAVGALGLRFMQYIDTRHVSFEPPSLALPWLANGVAVAGLLLGGQRLAPAVLVGSVALWRGLAHDPWITVLIDGTGEMLCAILIVRLLVRWDFHRDFDRLRDLIVLVAAAAAGRTVAAAADVLALQLTIVLTPAALTPAMLLGNSPIPGANFQLPRQEMESVLRWWMNGFAGITLFVPIVVSVSSKLRRTLVERWQEAALFALILGLGAVTVAFGPSSNWRLLVLALSVVIVAWPAVRFGVALASAATLVLSLAAVLGYSIGRGPLAAVGAAEGAGIVWAFIGLLAATGLFLTTVVADYQRTLGDLKALQARFEAFFEAVPMPLFVFEEATGRITMVNAAAIRKYGYSRAEFLGMNRRALIADAMAPDAPTAATALTERVATPSVHRARSGVKFEVEQTATPVNVGGRMEYLCFVIDVTERNDLRRRLLEASDVERRRLAHDLHDELGQILTGMSLGITTLRRITERGGTPSVEAAQFLAEAIGEARRSCDRILHGLSPLEAGGGDLLAALRNLPMRVPPGSRSKLRVDISAESALTVALPTREHLYHIARECVNNALKHSGATSIRVSAAITPEYITLAVEDNGAGFDPAAGRSSGLGLRSLALRSEAVHGRLSIERRRQGGMRVSCRCPQPAASFSYAQNHEAAR